MRSLLFVPSVEKMVSKIKSCSSDAYILDLEDAIPISDKKNALIVAKSYLTANTDKVFIRLDPLLMKEQICDLDEYDFEGFMIPKFEDPVKYADYLKLLKKRFIIALVETPKGIINLDKIASCEWINAIAFGAEDYTACVSMHNKEEYLIGLKTQLVMYAKAYNKLVFDTPSFVLDDLQLLKKEVLVSKELGFNGKLAIHPKQIPIINNVFNAYDFEYIKYVISEYERNGNPIVVIDGKIYEKMHIRYLESILKECSV